MTRSLALRPGACAPPSSLTVFPPFSVSVPVEVLATLLRVYSAHTGHLPSEALADRAALTAAP